MIFDMFLLLYVLVTFGFLIKTLITDYDDFFETFLVIGLISNLLIFFYAVFHLLNKYIL